MGIIIAITLVTLTYFLSKPKKVGSPRKSKKFGEGLLQGAGDFDWWNFS